MPFVLAADVGFIAVGVILFLLCVGGSYLIDGIASRLPVFGFLGLKLDLAAVFRRITWPVVAFITTIGALHFRQVEQWLRGIGYMLIQTAFGAVQTAAHHAGQIAHVTVVQIPQATIAAIRAAEEYEREATRVLHAQVYAAQARWAQHHTWNDAQHYIAVQHSAPSVEHALLAGFATTLIATEIHAQQLHDQLKSYVNTNLAGVHGGADATYGGQTLTGVAGAIAIPVFAPGTAIPVEAVRDGTITAVGAAVAVIATKIVDCLVSKCAGNNNFDNLLKDALGLVGAVEFAAFVNDVVHNPGGVVAQYEADAQRFIPAVTHGPDDIWKAIEGALGL